MFNNLGSIIIMECEYKYLRKYISEYYINNGTIVDSFWETQVRESKFYKITDDNDIVGYFAIHKETVLVLFNIFEKYRNISQELFTIIKKYESVKEALIPTGDEFFISHAFDNYTKIENQAYFSIYTDKNPKEILNIELQLADIEKDMETLKLCYDFLKSEIENKKNNIDEEIYIAKHGNNIIGFGIIEYQKIVDIYASIGMIVREEFRQKGYGANILNSLKNIVKSKGIIPISGCWYYNHNSKKTMESAGAYSKTRLLRFYF
jgi:predicted acetyltransferase